MSPTEVSVEKDQPIANGSITAHSETTEASPVAPTSQASNSLTVAHLQSYPTVNAVFSYAISLSVVKQISSRATPIYDAAKSRSQPILGPLIKRASPIFERADKLGDSLLSTVDNRIPQLKTAKPQEVIDIARRPIESVVGISEAYATAVQDRFHMKVVKPIQDAGESFKSHYIAVYDNKGKPLINTRIDPLLSPLNKELEQLINGYLPVGGEIGKSDTEITRTIRLAFAAISRFRPFIGNQATHLAALPKETKTHVQEVYESKRCEYAKDKSPVSSTVYASLATWKQLSSEGATFAGSILSPKSTKAEADEIVVN